MACETERNPLGVFKCQLCALTAPYSYKGQQPPDSQSVVLLEESYVLRDPFTPDKGRFLVVGSRCSMCSRLVCVGPVGAAGVVLFPPWGHGLSSHPPGPFQRKGRAFWSVCCVLGTCVASNAFFNPVPAWLGRAVLHPFYRNAVYSTPRDFASPVSRTTWMLSLRKSSKTWRKRKSPPRGLPASAVLDHECSRVPGPQRCPPGARAHVGFHGPRQRRGRDGAAVPAFFLGHWEPCLQPGGAGVCLQQHQGQELAETAPIARPQMPALRDRSRPPSQPPA
ncbi:cysteine-rich DPF motif domain-containing protein 1 isoform 1-T3 [Dama dama]